MDLTAFTDKLLDGNVFNCTVCEELLSLPITLVANGGNVCGGCVKNNGLAGLINTKLGVILSELRIPCRFKNGGCKERVEFPQLKEHEAQCKFHEKPCVMNEEGCKWKGVQSLFPGHFIEKHPDHVLVSPSLFTVDINVEANTSITKLLKGKQEYLMKIRVDKDKDMLIYTVCDVKNSINSYDCVLKHVGRNGNSVETKCQVSSINKANETLINLGALQQMTEAVDSVTVQVKFASGEKEFMDEKILQYFECPVCKMLMKPPIYQCKFGHSFCSDCKPKLEKCPNCRAMFGTTRNYSLEGLTTGICYTCVYHSLGCEEMLTVEEADKHEAVCPYKPFSCPLDDCSFRGTYSNIAEHLDIHHKDHVISADFYETTIAFRLENMADFFSYHEKFYMVFDENIFRLNFKRNYDYSFWAVEVLRKKHEESVFVYDIGVIDMRKPDRKLIRCDVCFADTNMDDLFKKCILFPNNILASYACTGMFTYYCKICERK